MSLRVIRFGPHRQVNAEADGDLALGSERAARPADVKLMPDPPTCSPGTCPRHSASSMPQVLLHRAASCTRSSNRSAARTRPVRGVRGRTAARCNRPVRLRDASSPGAPRRPPGQTGRHHQGRRRSLEWRRSSAALFLPSPPHRNSGLDLLAPPETAMKINARRRRPCIPRRSLAHFAAAYRPRGSAGPREAVRG